MVHDFPVDVSENCHFLLKLLAVVFETGNVGSVRVSMEDLVPLDLMIWYLVMPNHLVIWYSGVPNHRAAYNVNSEMVFPIEMVPPLQLNDNCINVDHQANCSFSVLLNRVYLHAYNEKYWTACTVD